MKYEKIIFIYPFNIGSFLNAKAGLEAIIEEGDNIDECWDKLRSDVKRLVAKEQGVIYDGPSGNKYLLDEVGQSPTPKPQEQRIGILASDILSCSDLKVLETYKFIKDTSQELKQAYDERFAELSRGLK